MREILFRGKRIDNGGWVEGLPMYNNSCKFIDKIELAMESGGVGVRIIPETVSQFIDEINGVKVFDGDVFAFDGSPYKYFVKIENDFQAICYHASPRYFDDLTGQHMRWGPFYRIKELKYEDRFVHLGNIHDNPELIGKEAHNA